MNQENASIVFTIVYSETHEGYDLFRDLKGLDNVNLVIVKKRKIKSRVLKFIRRIHLNSVIGKYINIPYKWKWYEMNNIIDVNEPRIHFIILFDLALQGISVKYLNKLFLKSNVKSIFFYINSVNTDLMRCIKRDMKKIKWDRIISFDSRDAEEYGYEKEIYQYYSKHVVEEIDKENKTDVCFVGALKKSRNRIVFSVYERMRGHGLKLDFNLMKTGFERVKKSPYEKEINYYTFENGRLSYDEVVNLIQKTSTILEIVQSNQNGPTLRYFEAVCYNKKLLTNNNGIKDLPFYDERYMRVFNKPEDIDVEWLKESGEINYHYNNEFSPIHLLKKVMEII